MDSKMAARDGNVRVVVRARPLNEAESGTNCIAVSNNSKSITIRPPTGKSFTFDYVADASIGQAEFFDLVGKPVSLSVLEGYHGCLLAYGQTGAGKTFTMEGRQLDDPMTPKGSSPGDLVISEGQGIIPRALQFLFERMEHEKNHSEFNEVVFKCKVSYLEIYNEQVADLLEPGSNNLTIREDVRRGMYVENLSERDVPNAASVYALFKESSCNRHVGSTAMNRESSRSHSVFTVYVESQRKDHRGMVNLRTSAFHLVDLAGSERQRNSESQGWMLKEAGSINKSLSALGNVIHALVDVAEGNERHVPYRDSKLTFLLKDSLGGNSKCTLVANVSPSDKYADESLSTLKFAQRAKMVRNAAVVNEDTIANPELLREEISRLKLELSKLRANGALQEIQNLAGPSPAEPVGMPTDMDHVARLQFMLTTTLRQSQHSKREMTHENTHLKERVEQLEALVDRLEKSHQSQKMILKLRENSLKRLETKMMPSPLKSKGKQAGKENVGVAGASETHVGTPPMSVLGNITASSSNVNTSADFSQMVKPGNPGENPTSGAGAAASARLVEELQQEVAVLRRQVQYHPDVVRYKMDIEELKEKLRKQEMEVDAASVSQQKAAQEELQRLEQLVTSIREEMLAVLEAKAAAESKMEDMALERGILLGQRTALEHKLEQQESVLRSAQAGEVSAREVASRVSTLQDGAAAELAAGRERIRQLEEALAESASNLEEARAQNGTFRLLLEDAEQRERSALEAKSRLEAEQREHTKVQELMYQELQKSFKSEDESRAHIEELTDALATAEAQARSLEASHAAVEASLHEQRLAMQEASRLWEDGRENVQRLSSELQRMSLEKSDLESALVRAEEQLASAEASLAATVRELEHSRAQHAGHAAEMRAHAARAEQLAEELRRAEARLVQMQGAEAKLQEKLQAMEAERCEAEAKLSRAMEAARNEERELRMAVDIIGAEREAMEAELKAVQERLLAAEARAQSLVGDLAAAALEQSQVQAALNESIAQALDSKKAAAEVVSERNNLVEQLQCAESEVSAMRAHVTDLNTLIEELRHEVREGEAEAASLQDKLAQEAEQSRVRLAERDAARADAEAKGAALAATQEQAARLQGRVEEQDAALADLRSRLDVALERVSSAEHLQLQAETALAVATEQLALMESRLITATGEAEAEAQLLRGRCLEAQAQAELAQATVETAVAAEESARASERAVRQELEALLGKYVQLEDMLDGTKAQFEEAAHMAEAMEGQLRDAQSTLQRLTKEKAQAEERLEASTCALAVAEEQYTRALEEARAQAAAAIADAEQRADHAAKAAEEMVKEAAQEAEAQVTAIQSAANEQISVVEAALEHKSEQARQLEAQVAAVQHAAQEELAAVTAQKDAEMQQAAEDAARRLEAVVAAAKETEEQLQREVEAARAERDAADAATSAAQATLAANNEAWADARANMSHAVAAGKAALEEVQAQLHARHARYDALLEEKKALAKALRDAERELEDAQGEMGRLNEQRLKDITEAAAKSAAEFEALAAAKEAVEHKLERTQKRLDELLANQAEVEKNVVALSQVMEQQEARYEALRLQLARTEEKLAAVEAQRKEAVTCLDEAVHQLKLAKEAKRLEPATPDAHKSAQLATSSRHAGVSPASFSLAPSPQALARPSVSVAGSSTARMHAQAHLISGLSSAIRADEEMVTELRTLLETLQEEKAELELKLEHHMALADDANCNWLAAENTVAQLRTSLAVLEAENQRLALCAPGAMGEMSFATACAAATRKLPLVPAHNESLRAAASATPSQSTRQAAASAAATPVSSRQSSRAPSAHVTPAKSTAGSFQCQPSPHVNPLQPAPEEIAPVVVERAKAEATAEDAGDQSGDKGGDASSSMQNETDSWSLPDAGEVFITAPAPKGLELETQGKPAASNWEPTLSAGNPQSMDGGSNNDSQTASDASQEQFQTALDHSRTSRRYGDASLSTSLDAGNSLIKYNLRNRTVVVEKDPETTSQGSCRSSRSRKSG